MHSAGPICHGQCTRLASPHSWSLFSSLPLPDGSLLAQSPIARFEERYEALRTQSRIPAISVVIAQGQRVVWARSFGFADLETGRRAFRYNGNRFSRLDIVAQ